MQILIVFEILSNFQRVIIFRKIHHIKVIGNFVIGDQVCPKIKFLKMVILMINFEILMQFSGVQFFGKMHYLKVANFTTIDQVCQKLNSAKYFSK